MAFVLLKPMFLQKSTDASEDILIQITQKSLRVLHVALILEACWRKLPLT